MSEGVVITARGPVKPEALGRVMMHEHLHNDFAQRDEKPFDRAKWPVLEGHAVPALRALKSHGCHAYLNMDFPPHRAEPWVYRKVSELADFHLILATGFYREIELGKYWAQRPEDQIWAFVREASVAELEEFCVREFEEGIHGSGVKPGVLKIGTSSREMTPTEVKAARAVARAQKRTGLTVATHANTQGTFKTQLDLLESEGVDPARVILGHTQHQVVEEWPAVRECMKRGATFAMTNLVVAALPERTQGWADAICRAFDQGFGEHLGLGMDGGFKVAYEELKANPRWRPRQGDSTRLVWSTVPGPPFTYFFTDVLPELKRRGVTDAMLELMLAGNPQRVIPWRKP